MKTKNKKAISTLIAVTIAFSILVAFSATASAAATWYVDDSGSNSNGGTSWTDAWQDISYAISHTSVLGGDTIMVGDGIYTITAAINVNKGVTITGNVANPENVLVKYSSAVTDKNCFDITVNNVMVQGIKAINGKRGFYLNGVTGCKVSNCIVSSCADKGIYVRNCPATSEATRVEVTGNIVSDCGNTWGSACIQTYVSPYTYIYNNIISSTNDKGINIMRSGATGTADRVQVIGNTISETKWPGIQVVGSPYTYVYSNTLTKCNYYGGDGTGDWDYASIHVQDDIGPTYSHHTVIDSNTVSDGINGIQTWSDYVTITNNDIYNMGLTYADTKGTAGVGDGVYYNSGIIIGSNWLTNNFKPTGTTVTCNNIHDNYWGLYVRDYATLSPGDPSALSVTAECNWWGDDSGPGGVGPGTGNGISTYVDYSPWLGFTVGTSPMTWHTDDSIQDAIDEASNGDTIVVHDGTYYENVNVYKEVTVQAVNPPTSTAIIYGSVDITADGVTFENFKVMPTATYTTDEAAIAVYASDVVVNNNIIDGITGDGSGYFTIKGIHVYSSTSSGISNIDLTNNIIQNVENQGTITAPYGGADGIMIQGVIDGVDVLGNTIEDIHSAGWAYGIEVTPTASDPSKPPQNIVIRENNILSVNDGSVYNVMADPYSAPYPGVGFSLDETYLGAGDGNASEVIVNCNSFVDTPYGAVNKDTGHILDAECNWWDDCTGPYEGILNPGGLGCNVLGLVDFDPWLTFDPSTSSLIYTGDPQPTTAVVLEATLSDSTSTGISGVDVDFYLDDVPVGSNTTDTNGVASLNIGTYPVGVYEVRVSDGCGCLEDIGFVAVYDPSAGFVTGGGWIYSDAGAYVPDPDAEGKASFGFVSKYKKGQQTPTGNTEFQFKAGNLNFHSDSYDWLVIAGHKAMYKGTGTINGDGNFGFMLSAIDEKLTPSTDDVDMFRIKIWDKTTDGVIYDNNKGSDPYGEPTTEIAGGQIVIHKKKAK